MSSLLLVGIAAVLGLYFLGTLGSAAASSSGIEGAILNKASAYGIDPAIVKAVCKVESNFNPNAINPSDPSYGLMQITPALAYDYKLLSSYKNITEYQIELLLNIKNNLDVACQFLAKLHNKYSFDRATQCYNVGEWGYILGRRNPDYLKKVKEAYYEYS